MSKAQAIYVCDQCGESQSRWQGRCVHCGEWNSLSKLHRAARPAVLASAEIDGAQRQPLAEVAAAKTRRLATGFAEFDRVLGGGLVPGSAVLLGGYPGAGKSTLLLQLLDRIAGPSLYVSGEESPEQVARRVRRLGLSVSQVQVLAQSDVEGVIAQAAAARPDVLVVDSIQVMHRSGAGAIPGGVAQVRACAGALVSYAKESGVVLLLVGHVTKDGSLAGPRVLEHLVDCSLMMESAEDGRFRTLRGHKNRFGATGELGIFAMTDTGLKEVRNPSAIFLSRGSRPAAGSLVVVLWEGTRPLLVELQTLVDDGALGNPRRLAVGLDGSRLAMLLAVLHRHGGLDVGGRDVFVNAVGGVRAQEPATDLAVLLATASSLRDRPLPQDLVVFGEVGLVGEVRPVTGGQERLHEAAKHGFHRAIVPAANLPKKSIAGMSVHGVETLSAALEAAAAIEI